jgi:hypothetical protein
MKIFRPRLRRWLIIGLLAIIVLPGLYFGAREYAWPAYKDWREAKLAKMARNFMASGDYDNALLTARQALSKNQRSLEHWKIAAAAAKAKNTPEVIYYQKNVAHLEKTLENQLELIRLALQYNDYRDALDTIDAIDPSAKQNPEFHQLAAKTFLAIGRPVAAKLSLYSLVSLRPENRVARLDLAEVELAEDADGKNQKVRDQILELSKTPELRVRALELLLKDAVARSDAPHAAEFAGQLQLTPTLTGEQHVLVLSGLAIGAPEKAEAYRHQLQTQFAKDPRGVVALANYYRTAGLQQEARKWFETFSIELRANPDVQEAVAAVYLESRDWAHLDQTIASAQWKQREFMRHAFLAYAARKSGRLTDANSEWRLAVIQAGDSVKSTAELITLVGRWGWQGEQYDLVWKLFALMPRNEAVSRQLIAWERSQGHTANLNRIFARLAEYSGDDRMVRNNFAYTSLLLDANLSRAFEYARANHQAEPANPFFVTTQAFALYKQNRPAEALALLETLRPAALALPERAMFHALFRVGAGDASGAADLLTGLKSTGFLPEERRLVTRTATEIARLNGEKGQDQLLYALSSRGEIDRSKGWLAILPDAVRTTATVEMQTTDSLFAIGDLASLGTQLRRSSWGEREYLRMALTAYVERSRDESSSRSYWRTAVGAAWGDAGKLAQLKALATQWGWRNEKFDVLARLFELDPSNREVFAELVEYHRSTGRTAELVNVLSTYLSAHPGDQEQRTNLAYYSMLSGLNLARAYVIAQDAYRANPTELQHKLVYAFALWKQHRAREAWDLLEEINNPETRPIPSALLRAAVLADIDRRDDARRILKTFNPQNALPEETNLATLLASRLKEDGRVSQLN